MLAQVAHCTNVLVKKAEMGDGEEGGNPYLVPEP